MITNMSHSTGSFSATDAIKCLLKAPLLSDLQSWSHWDLIFAPSLGPLLDWLLNEGYFGQLSCIVTCDGRILRIDNSANMHVVLTGATGLIGAGVLHAMLTMKTVTKVSIISRRPVPMADGHEKAHVLLHKDFQHWDKEIVDKVVMVVLEKVEYDLF